MLGFSCRMDFIRYRIHQNAGYPRPGSKYHYREGETLARTPATFRQSPEQGQDHPVKC